MLSDADARLRVALIQYCPGTDVGRSLADLGLLIRRAAQDGARFVLTPEYATCLSGRRGDMQAAARSEVVSTVLEAFARWAEDHAVWILLGSHVVPTNDGRMRNRSFLIDDAGRTVAHYDKIHMFDAELPDGKSIRESSAYAPGDRAVVARSPWGGIGLTVCYDIRFPLLYRRLAQAGAAILTVPAAFATATGPDHWELLLRTRAVECGSFVLAPATWGEHAGGRSTFGHSMVIDPWGSVLGQAETGNEVIIADLDLDAVRRVRAAIPAYRADPPFTIEASPESSRGVA